MPVIATRLAIASAALALFAASSTTALAQKKYDTGATDAEIKVGNIMVEMVYHLQLNAALGPELGFMGVRLNATKLNSWLGAGFVLATGLGLFELTRRQFLTQWSAIQDDIEKEIKRRELL